MEVARHPNGEFYPVKRIVAFYRQGVNHRYLIEWAFFDFLEDSWVDEGDLRCQRKFEVSFICATLCTRYIRHSSMHVKCTFSILGVYSKIGKRRPDEVATAL